MGRCWCGCAESVASDHPDFVACPDCGTLQRRAAMPSAPDPDVALASIRVVLRYRLPTMSFRVDGDPAWADLMIQAGFVQAREARPDLSCAVWTPGRCPIDGATEAPLRIVRAPVLGDHGLDESEFWLVRDEVLARLQAWGWSHVAVVGDGRDAHVIASREPLRETPAASRSEVLSRTAGSRVVARLLAMADQRDRLRQAAQVREGRWRDQVDDARRAERSVSAELQRIGQRYEGLRSLVGPLRSSKVYRGMVRVGAWRALDAQLAWHDPRGGAAGRSARASVSARVDWSFSASTESHDDRNFVAIDLTALRPGGENGGAKRVAVALVEAMTRRVTDRSFVVMVAADCAAEFDSIGERANVDVACVPSDRSLEAVGGFGSDRRAVVAWCPMTAPQAVHPGVPWVCTVHDLQYRTHPEFFTAAQRLDRDAAFGRAESMATTIVAVSDYVRGTVLEESSRSPDSVVTIANPRLDPMRADASTSAGVLAERGLTSDGYLLYPANAWPHKNHAMLLTAFGQFAARHPSDELHLVFTGADRPDPEWIQAAIERLGLIGRVSWLGFVDPVELGVLFAHCRGLVFPSLYEGFGLPVVEAMAAGRPVACSDRAALPEIASAEAAVLFDPRRPASIRTAIEELADPNRAARIGSLGQQRAAAFANADSVADRYWEVLQQAETCGVRAGVGGVDADGRAGRSFAVGCPGPARVELRLSNPTDRPVAVVGHVGASTQRCNVEPGATVQIEWRTERAVAVEFTVDPPGIQVVDFRQHHGAGPVAVGQS